MSQPRWYENLLAADDIKRRGNLTRVAARLINECLHRINAIDGRMSVGIISSNLSASSYQWALACVTVAWLF